jgi:hypothetical protein
VNATPEHFGRGGLDRPQVGAPQPLEGELAIDDQVQLAAVEAEPYPTAEPEAETVATDALLKYLLDFSDDNRVIGFLVQRGHTGSRNLLLGNCAAA